LATQRASLGVERIWGQSKMTDGVESLVLRACCISKKHIEKQDIDQDIHINACNEMKIKPTY
jgi:hypothetical protein